MDEAERCTQIGLIYGGKLIASDTRHEIKGLIPGHLLEFTPSDDSCPRQGLMDSAGRCYWKCKRTARSCTLFVDDRPAPQGRRSNGGAGSQGMAHESIREIEVRMEEAFISLVRQQAKAEQDQPTRLPGSH